MSLPRYPAYKGSGVAWLGEVPRHWEVKPVKSVASCNDEVLDESTSEDYEIEYVEISGVDAGRGIASTDLIPFGTAPSRARRRVKDGDVLVSTVRTYLRSIAPINNPPVNMIASTGFAVIHPRAIVPHFLGYLFQAEFLISEVIARSVGVSYPAINASDLMRLNVPIPLAKEQSAIAAFLDRETGKIDALVAEQEKLIQLLREKRQAVISRAVTKGLNPAATMKDSGIEWLGEVPEHWEVVGLTKYMDSVVDYRGRTPTKADDGIFLITAKNIRDGLIDYEASEEFILEEEYEEVMSRGKPLIGDLLFTTEAPLGQVANIDREGIALAQRVIKFRGIVGLLDNYFLKYWIMGGSCQYDLYRLATGSTALGIKGSKVGMVRLCLPPIEEQQNIAAFLDRETAKLDALTAEAQRGIELLKERRSALISAAVTGKIDVRNVGLKPDLQAVTGKIDVRGKM